MWYEIDAEAWCGDGKEVDDDRSPAARAPAALVTPAPAVDAVTVAAACTDISGSRLSSTRELFLGDISAAMAAAELILSAAELAQKTHSYCTPHAEPYASAERSFVETESPKSSPISLADRFQINRYHTFHHHGHTITYTVIFPLAKMETISSHLLHSTSHN